MRQRQANLQEMSRRNRVRRLSSWIMARDTSGSFAESFELLFVAGTLVTLLGLALPFYTVASIRAELAEVLGVSAVTRLEIVVERSLTGEWPDSETFVDLGTMNPEYDLGKYTSRFELDSHGVLTALLREEETAKEIAGRRISFLPVVVAENISAPVSWVCGNRKPAPGLSTAGINRTNVADEILPSVCKEK